MKVAYADPLAIRPLTKPVNATVEVPGSKSITNRMLIIAAMAGNPVTLTGALFSDDSHYMVKCLQDLGFDVTANEEFKTIRVLGTGGIIPKDNAELFVGVAGTAARFLTAFCATRDGGQFKLDGTEQMRIRPMKGLLDALIQQGTSIESNNGFFPATLRPTTLSGGRIQLEASASTQLLSALLLVAPLAKHDLLIEVSGGAEKKPFIKITQELMYRFGQPEQVVETLPNGNALVIVKAGIPYKVPEQVAIEPDASAASYFLSLPLIAGGTITIKGLHSKSLQGDYGYTEVLKETGVTITEDHNGTTATLAPKDLPGKAVSRDFWPISDTFLTLAAIAPLLKGRTHIEGIAHTRLQETDRVYAMATELTKLNQTIDESEGMLEIQPSLITPTTIDTYHDHRLAMSFGILACFNLYGDGSPWLKINNPGCCAKTFPEFFNVLESIRNQ